MAWSFASLFQVATLRHGQMAQRSAITYLLTPPKSCFAGRRRVRCIIALRCTSTQGVDTTFGHFDDDRLPYQGQVSERQETCPERNGIALRQNKVEENGGHD